MCYRLHMMAIISILMNIQLKMFPNGNTMSALFLPHTPHNLSGFPVECLQEGLCTHIGMLQQIFVLFKILRIL